MMMMMIFDSVLGHSSYILVDFPTLQAELCTMVGSLRSFAQSRSFVDNQKRLSQQSHNHHHELVEVGILHVHDHVLDHCAAKLLFLPIAIDPVDRF